MGALEGVGGVAVDLKGKTVTVEYDPDKVTVDAIRNAVEDQGYNVK